MPLQLLAPRDVARRLGVSTSRVTQLDREGRLVALRDASGRRFWEADAVEHYAAKRERSSTRGSDSSPAAAVV
jgi:predicted site-specific integrase-resolvase